MCKLWIFSTVILSTVMSYAQQNQIDFIGPLSPEFAQFGDFDVGVRTIEVIKQELIDRFGNVPKELITLLEINCVN